MKTYHEIKDKHTKAIDNIITKNNVFFAFSNSQLEEGKAKINITENKDLVSIGAGGFIPRQNADLFFKEMKEETARYNKELKDAKEAQEQAILYELNNHESFYAGNIDPVFELFEGIYTKDEIIKVYKKNVNKPHKPEDRLKTNIND
jgi:hypothetical protein